MSAEQWWMVVAAVLAFFSALVDLLAPPAPAWLARLASATLAAAVGCVAVGLWVSFP